MTDTDPAVHDPSHGSQKLLVVGLGASAGGIEALRTFFAHVPADSGSAYVVILHLSPDHDSKLAEVLQTTPSIPVTQVTQPVRIEADHVYVVPPNRRLEIADGMLTLSEMTQREHRRSPVDVFFRALADAHGSRSVVRRSVGNRPERIGGPEARERVRRPGDRAVARRSRRTPTCRTTPSRPAWSTSCCRVAEMPARIADYHARLQQIDVVAARRSAIRPTRPMRCGRS